jgi:diguanylate cyclase (GGDEF)-like protein/PAS domain S-box-containing protein
MRRYQNVSRKVIGYAATAALLFVGSIVLRYSKWQGNVELHTLMELAATLLALNVGVLALVRFYSQKDNAFLFIGSGFIGTGVLDAYHAVVTSSHFAILFPSPPVSLIPWSWLASRLFLSVALCLSWFFWRVGKTVGDINEKLVYTGFSILTVLSFLFFATVPLPTGYVTSVPFGRPQEFVPAVFFGLALIGYMQKGRWRSEPFEHWLVLSLIVNFVTQATFMSTSEHLYDASFDAAHFLKLGSYNCVLIGLLASMYRLFWTSISEPVMIFDLQRDAFVEVNRPMAQLFGYTEDEMLGLDIGALSADGIPYDWDGLKSSGAGAKSGKRLTSEWQCKAKDGRLFWAEMEIQRRAFGAPGTLLLRAHDITDRKNAEYDLRLEQEFTSALIGSMPGLFILIDQAGCIVRWNANLPILAGLSDERLQDSAVMSIVVESDRPAVRARLHEAFIQGSAVFEFGVSSESGEVRTIRWSGRIITNKGDRYLLAVGMDVTDARTAEALVRRSEERFRTIFGSVNDGIIVHELGTGAFADINTRICEMFGYTREELLKLNLGDLSTGVSPYTLEEITSLLERVRTSDAVVFDWHCKARDGHLFWAEVSVRRAVFGGQDVLLSTTRDITDRRRASEQISHMARHDSLTGLVNRHAFVEALEQAIARADRGSKTVAVLYIDLDHFKDVNDTLGHPVGDLLLQTVAKRLRASARASDTVARFGGDEFATILAEIREAAEAAVVSARLLDAVAEPPAIQHDAAAIAGNIADKIVKTVAEPILIQGNQIHSGATVGISVYGPDSHDAETMLSHADLALYRAKAEGRGTCRFFTEAMDTEVRERVSMNTELREAIISGQLFLLYQPQVDIVTSRVVGLEALVRWRHPTRGIIGPGNFIPGAEKSGLIVPLGHWVMREACRQTKQWCDAGVAPPLIAVNLSAVQFRRPLELESDIAAIMAEFQLPATLLELELTESVLMEASREHNDLLLRLRKSGHRVAIDDFGSGYSSLEYLRRYPVDRIKIAQSFIADIGIVSGSDAIVRAALGLARELNIEVVVEGVETETQLAILTDWGGRIVQGYYYARPLPADAVTTLLRAGTIKPAGRNVAEMAAPA